MAIASSNVVKCKILHEGKSSLDVALSCASSFYFKHDNILMIFGNICSSDLRYVIPILFGPNDVGRCGLHDTIVCP